MLIKGLYTVTEFQYKEQEVKSIVELNKDHEIFKGHFPGNPVMPGVCMLQIIKELTEQALGKSLLLTVASNIKFMAIINPNLNPTLSLLISITEEGDIVKIKNMSLFDETIALKLSATFKEAK
jgi:3-hydroxyacyl-[acyl-carrier-protein] dehydratase